MTIAAPIDMTELQNTIHSWFSGNTGLVTIWEQQSSPRPAYPYASLNVMAGPTPVSPIWDASHEYNPNGEQGEELDFNAGIPCMFTISAKVFVNRPTGSNPGLDSKQYLLRALAGLQHDDRVYLLQSKTIGFVRSQSFDNLSEIRNDGFVNISGMDFIFSSVMNSQWYATFIERVHVSSNLTKDFDIDISIPLIVVDQLGGNMVTDEIGSIVVA